MENTLSWLEEMEDNNESWVKISSVITMLKKEQSVNYYEYYLKKFCVYALTDSESIIDNLIRDFKKAVDERKDNL